MTIQEAINKLDENIPEPNNKMVDLEHLPIAIAWKTVKEELAQARKETAKEILQAVDQESSRQTISITNHLRKKYGVSVEECI